MFRAALAAALLALFAAFTPVMAQDKAGAPPAGLSQPDFDRLVDAISKAVVERMKKDGATPAPAKPAATEATPTTEAEVARFIGRAEAVLLAFPRLFTEIGRIPGELVSSPDRERGLAAYLLLLGLTVLAATGADVAVRLATTRWREALARKSGPSEGPLAMLRLVALAALDGVGLLAVWAVSYGAIGAWFPGSDPQARLAGLILASVFSWRLYLFAFRVVLRPELAPARLAAMDDSGAKLTFKAISLAVVVVLAVRVVLRILIALKSPSEAISAGQLVANLLILAAFIGAAKASAVPVAAWFSSLARRGSVWEALGRHWLAVAIPFFLLLVATQLYAAISLRFTVPAAMLFTLNTVMGLLLFETLLAAAAVRLNRQPVVQDGEAAAPRAPRVADLIARCVRVAVLIAAISSVAERWIVDVVGLVDAAQWGDLTRGSLRAGGTLFVAYVAWEIVRFVSDRYVSRAGAGASVIDEDAMGASTASRLATMMPLMRIALFIVISVLALLIVLTELGVNVTPLIAGASVFGLAVSFGSQTLVRDIVSGIFYLADDAFRIGEYIDCGKAKGTVEGFTLRSIKLRHQNGQVHTIPFGQLGQITNFSRDWSTVKFNLRFARDTDVEKLRKAVKRIGQDMLDVPELKAEMIEPLKMQGVADIADNALIVRFKFTVKPGKPSFVQRDAIKRMVRELPPLGIAFANAMVSVQTMGGPNEQAAGAAAQSLLQKVQAEAAATTST